MMACLRYVKPCNCPYNAESIVQISYERFKYSEIFKTVELLKEAEKTGKYPPRFCIYYIKDSGNTTKDLRSTNNKVFKRSKDSETLISAFTIFKDITGTLLIQ